MAIQAVRWRPWYSLPVLTSPSVIRRAWVSELLFVRQIALVRQEGTYGEWFRPHSVVGMIESLIIQGKAWLALTPLSGAALVAISRTMDYRRMTHHRVLLLISHHG